MILSANCISLAVVVVEVSKPVIPVGAPVESKMSVLSGVTGTAKFAWFKMFVSQPLMAGTGVLTGNEPNVAADLLATTKPLWSSDDQHEGQRCDEV
jgi:hypothetical protein